MNQNDVLHILIDTCVWKTLVLTDSVNENLRRLLYWVDNGKIKIVCPEILKKEWREHRSQEIGKIEKSIDKKIKKIKQNKCCLNKVFDISRLLRSQKTK